ncbi:hypothetical protein ACFRFJ_17090 [Streptomyces hydrogenans]|uniref:hypothetical protein n=1 Tax=Streptomyces hydrogenans TaxID=1873719 RepID=UPI003674B07F
MRALPYGETVTILRPGPPTQDAYGNDVPGPDTEIPVAGCALEPMDGTGAGANEITDARDTVISGMRVFFPYGTEVRATDRARIGMDVYEVYGDSEPGYGQGYRSPFTASQGPVVVRMTMVTG